MKTYRLGQRVKSVRFINGKIKVPPEWTGEIVAVKPSSLSVVWEETGDLMVMDVEDVESCLESLY